MTFPLAPTDAGGDAAGLVRQALRQVAAVVNRSLGGKLNCTGSVTLRASQATTTVTDARASSVSHITLTALTANAAAIALPYPSTRSNGSFVLTHASNANTDKTFSYSVIG